MKNYYNLKWWMILFMTLAHILAFYGTQILYNYYKQSWDPFLKILIQLLIMVFMGGIGITVGAHRLWTHRSFKAKLPTRIMLMILNSFANQGSIYKWVTDHRVHHKFTDTNADPHNTKRGERYHQK